MGLTEIMEKLGDGLKFYDNAEALRAALNASKGRKHIQSNLYIRNPMYKEACNIRNQRLISVFFCARIRKPSR